MNQNKRQLSIIQSVNIKTKKSRSELNILSSVSNSCLENLSTELFHEIFEYLDIYDIYNAFSNLNIRFQNLITYSSIPIKINLSSKSKLVLKHDCQHLIIPYKHRIISLHLTNESIINEYFNYCFIDSSFNRLESIILNGLTTHKLLMILFFLNSLPRLFSLTISMEDEYDYDLSDIYRLIFSLSTLKYNKVSLLSYEEIDIIISNPINTKFSSIEYLVLNYACTLNQLISLLCHTPKLCHLTCEQLNESNENIKDLSIKLSYLKYISIKECHIEFDEFEEFIKKISLQLETLSINISGNINFLHANRWEQLIKKYMPYLKKFYFNYDQYIDDDMNKSSDFKFINQFTSSFWLEQKWFCELKINQWEIFLSIYPYKKEWFNFDENICIEPYSNQQINDNYAIQLTIEYCTLMKRIRLLIEKIKSNCVTIQLTHLNINCHNMSIDTLIEIIRLLPNLQCLKLLHLSSLQLKSLSVEDIKNQLAVSIINKIKKVKLEKVTDKNQIQFFLNLCPRIQYLELNFMANIDVGMIIKFIFMNQMTHIPNLCFLCLHIPNANDNIIERLVAIITLETLIDNYTIERKGEKIFLQWKLQ